MSDPQRPQGLPRIASYPLPQADELPLPRAPWTLQPERAALLVHDMQRYFVDAFSVGEEPISTAQANIARLLDQARKVGVPVFYTAQQGNQDRRDRGLQADLWGPGMRALPEHQDIIDALLPQAQDLLLVKHRYSAFQRSNLETLMRVRRRDQLIITGVYAHIGCLATAAEAFQRDIEPFLVADALADFSRAQHDMTLAWAAGCCAVPLTTSAVLQTLQ